MGDTGTVKFLVRGEAVVACYEERIIKGVGKISKVFRHAIIRVQTWLSCDLCIFFFFFFHVLTAFSLGGVHSLFKKSLSHTNTTDSSFSSFKMHLLTDHFIVSTLLFASDIKTSHWCFTTIWILPWVK